MSYSEFLAAHPELAMEHEYVKIMAYNDFCNMMDMAFDNDDDN